MTAPVNAPLSPEHERVMSESLDFYDRLFDCDEEVQFETLYEFVLEQRADAVVQAADAALQRSEDLLSRFEELRSLFKAADQVAGSWPDRAAVWAALDANETKREPKAEHFAVALRTELEQLRYTEQLMCALYAEKTDGIAALDQPRFTPRELKRVLLARVPANDNNDRDDR